jgi:hypothetical protein
VERRLDETCASSVGTFTLTTANTGGERAFTHMESDDVSPVPDPGVVMSRQATLRGLLTHHDRVARRALERELADYATASDRDDLAALIAGRGVADSEAAAVLVRQARSDLFRAN